ncbi:hypothetical protein KC19_7G160900 [Ceratodon purpureus]|uniref:Cytochrome P450 n=1 Tax=Ceratodon purpureus TaxID=3225 RepID=A0A8T0HBM0_CERPU|nr:hypothetical protein KC19_7G160900 [Ceratodon purpureus]
MECCYSSGAWHPFSQVAHKQTQELASRPSRSSHHRSLAPLGQVSSSGHGKTGEDIWTGDVTMVRATTHCGSFHPCCRGGDSQDSGRQFLRASQKQLFTNYFPRRYSSSLCPLLEDVTFQCDTPARLHLKKILHIQLNTAKQLKNTASLRAVEIAHMLRMIPQDGKTAVSVRNYVDVVVTNILSFMILKKRFMAVGALHAGQGDELAELEQVRQFRLLMEGIAKFSLENDYGDFIPIFKLIDIQGIRSRMWSIREQMDAFASKIVFEHLEQRKSCSLHEKDMVHVLLDQMEDDTLGFKITNQMVSSAVWNAFSAGTDTAVHAVEWAISECMHNPNVMSKAQAELDAVVGKSRRVEESDIPNLKYLHAICKEVFRLHPASPILFPHWNKNACMLFGYDIPAGTSVIVNVGAIARDPGIWEDPLVFKPERFLEGMPHANTDVQGHHFELLPFGTGRRQCPGIGLSLAMVHILTATLLQGFDWSLPKDLRPEDLNMAEAEGILSVRAEPLRAILKPRLSIPPIVN